MTKAKVKIGDWFAVFAVIIITLFFYGMCQSVLNPIHPGPNNPILFVFSLIFAMGVYWIADLFVRVDEGLK